MLDLAILNDSEPGDIPLAETNSGELLTAPDWGTDTDPKLVAFLPSATTCEIVDCEDLANDIGYALNALEAAGVLKHGEPGWYLSLKLYAAGAPSVSYPQNADSGTGKVQREN